VTPTNVPGQYLLTGYEFVPGELKGYDYYANAVGSAKAITLAPSVGGQSDVIGLGHAALNHSAVTKNLTLNVELQEQDFTLATLNTGDGDNTIRLDHSGIVHAGGGNDTIDAGGDNAFLDGGAGNDLIMGSYNQDDIIIGGSGNDDLRGESGNDRYYFMAGDTGIDVLYDTGVSGSYGGTIDSNTVVFGKGVDVTNFTYSWGIESLPSYNWGSYSYDDLKLYKTLDITWQADSVVRIVLPRADEDGYYHKTGIQFFEFADGSRMTFSQILALAPPSIEHAPILNAALQDQVATEDRC
jgi:RTX calcium-binding nonapeptide repeat (4 copies)